MNEERETIGSYSPIIRPFLFYPMKSVQDTAFAVQITSNHKVASQQHVQLPDEFHSDLDETLTQKQNSQRRVTLSAVKSNNLKHSSGK
jgi:hypothetical protein